MPAECEGKTAQMNRQDGGEPAMEMAEEGVGSSKRL